jgi:hypothetical protein
MSGGTVLNPYGEREKVVVTSGGSARLPAWQAGGFKYIPIVNQVPISSVWTSTSLASTAKVRVTIPKGTVLKVGSLTIRITFTVSTSTAQVVCSPYWLDRIDFPSSSDGQSHTTRWADNLLIDLLAGTSGSQWPCVSQPLNIMGDNTYLSMGPTPALPIGTYTFDIPVVGAFFSTLCYYMDGARGDDFLIDLYPAGNIVASGTGTIAMTAMTVLIDSVALRDADMKEIPRMLSTAYEAKFLNPITALKTSYSLTANALNTIDLNSVRGRCSHALMIIRAAGASNTSNGFSTMYNPGDTCTIDLQTASSSSILGGGTAIPLSYLRKEWWCRSFPSSFSCDKPFIMIPFSDNLPKAYMGVMDGFIEFNGDSKKLVINLPAAPTSEVQTFTPSGTAAAGYYRFSFRGQLSAPLAYNAVVATMKSAFEAIPAVQARSITVTFSGPATATFTGTFVHPETAGLPELVQIIPSLLDATPVPVSIPTTLTTKGTAGITTGTYDIYLYFYQWRMITAKQGKLFSKDL